MRLGRVLAVLVALPLVRHSYGSGGVGQRNMMSTRVADSGAPDGCHLHTQTRAVRSDLSTAVWARPLVGRAACR